MAADLYQLDLPPEILSRGFWLYAFNIVGPKGELFCYVGMTGDVSGVAQSPIVRTSAHLGFNRKNNAIRRLLGNRGVAPESCKRIALLAYGPVFPYPNADFEANRRRVGSLERQLWTAAAGHNTMLNERPNFAEEFDRSLWEGVRAAFAPHLKLPN